MTDVTCLSTDPLARAAGLFRALAAPRLATLEAAIRRLDAGPAPDDALAEIAATAHKIGGTASTLGFTGIGKSAAAVENLIAAGAPVTAILAGLEPLLDSLAGLANDG